MKRMLALTLLALATPLTLPVIAKDKAVSATPFIRPDVKAYLDNLKKMPRPPMNAQTIAMIRKIPPETMTKMLAQMGDAPMPSLAVNRSFTTDPVHGSINIRLFDVKAERPAGPILVFYHGGGFVVGSIESHASLAAELSRQLDVPVVSVDYHLAPESRWPIAPMDAELAARWVADHGRDLNREITGLILSGDSAGGTLTLTTALSLRVRPASVPVKLAIPLYPMADASKTYPSMTAFGDGYGLDTASMDYFESAYQANKNSWLHSAILADLKGFPPTVLATASLDPLHDGGVAFVQKLKKSGVKVKYYEAKGNIHGFATFRKAIPSAQDDLKKILDMAKAMLAKAR